MKKRKYRKTSRSTIAFFIVVTVAVVACLAAYAIFGPRDKAPGRPTEPTTTPANTTPATTPTHGASTEPAPTDTPVDPDSEELDWGPIGDPYFSPGGYVYRNDKTLSIDIPVDADGVTHTFTFGYNSGKCNKYLYINPGCADATAENKYGYILKSEGNTLAASLVYDPAQTAENVAADANVVLGRTYDVQQSAEYHGPKDPGAIWITQDTTTEESWVDVRVVELASYRIIATIRLEISRNENGTYSLSGVQNKNLRQNNDQTNITDLGLETATHVAMDTIRSGEIVSFASDTIDESRLIVEWCDKDTKTYYDSMKQLGSSQHAYSGLVDYPLLAVTYNPTYRGMQPITLYVRELESSLDGGPGYYETKYYDFLRPASADTIMDSEPHW